MTLLTKKFAAMSKSSYFYFYFFTIAPIWHQIWKLDLDCLFVCNAITHERFDISSLNLAHICIIRVPQPLYRLANKGPFSHRLANNSKTFLEYRISVCYWVSNKCKIVFFCEHTSISIEEGTTLQRNFQNVKHRKYRKGSSRYLAFWELCWRPIHS